MLRTRILLGALLAGLWLALLAWGAEAEPPRMVQLSTPMGLARAPNADVTDIAWRYDLSGPMMIPNPIGLFRHGQKLHVILKSPVPQKLTWGRAYTEDNGIPLPAVTTGKVYDHFLFLYNGRTWGLLATTQPWLAPVPP